MPKNDETTTKFKVDISELRKSFQEAQRQVRLANSEFQAATAGMDKWSSSADGLSAKVHQLNSVIDAENKKLDSLKAQYELVAKEQGENSAAAENLRIKINNQQATVNKAVSELNKYTRQLDEVQNASDDAADGTEEMESATDRLRSTISQQERRLEELSKAYSDVVLEQGASSREAQGLRGDISQLSSELNENRTKLNNAQYATDDLGDSFDDAENSSSKLSDGFTVMKGAIANLVADGIKNLASSIVNLASDTREYREDMAKLHTAFDVAGFSAQAATDVYKDFYAVLGEEDRSVEAVNHLAKMVDSEEDLATWTDICTGVWATFGDSLPIEGLTEAANETAKVGQVIGPLADALNWAGESEDAFNEKLAACNSEQERQKLIMETLNGIYNEAADTYRQNNADIMAVNQANSDLTDAYAQLGATAEPIIATIKQGFADLLNAALEMTEGVDFSSINEKIKAGFDYLITTILPKIQEGFNWIVENKDIIVAAIVAIGAAFVGFKAVTIIQGIVTAFTTLIPIIKSVGLAQAALNVVMAANPIGLIVAAIAGLVAGFIYLWNNCDEFRQFWIDLWEAIKQAVSTAVDVIITFFSETIPNAWSSFLEFCSTFIESIVTFFSELPGRIWEWLQNTINNIATWASDIVTKAKEAGQNFINNIVTFFQQLPYKIGYYIGVALGNIVKWSVNIATKAKEAGQKFITNIVTFFKELPSKIWNFLKNTVKKTATFVTNMVTKAKELGKKFIDNVVTFFKELPGKVQEFFKTTIQKAAEFAVNIAIKAKEAGQKFIDNAINFIKTLPSKVWEFLTNTIAKAAQFATDLGKKGLEAGKKLLDSVVTGVKELPKKMLEIGKNIVDGVWKGITNAADTFKTNVKNFFGGIVDGAKDALGIHSPSRVFRDSVGKMIVLGLSEGIKSNASAATEQMKNLTNDILSEAENGNFQDAFGDFPTLNSIKSSVNKAKQAVANQQTISNVYNFNQTNNSPKALSRLEIYRQTKNQMAMLKGV